MSASPQSQSVRPIMVGNQQIRVGDQVEPIYAVELHYWRLERGKWDDILDKVKALGFNAICVYIP